MDDPYAWLREERARKDRAFAAMPDSPIPDRGTFKGLHYFEPDPRYRFAARWTPETEPRPVRIGTSTGEVRDYLVAGRLEFELDGRALALTAYDDGISEGLFVPFRDATSGEETYGAGRYLHVERPRGDEAIVDLNLAYNPYCAYSEAWSCPLPPRENWLDVPVRAGERAYP